MSMGLRWSFEELSKVFDSFKIFSTWVFSKFLKIYLYTYAISVISNVKKYNLRANFNSKGILNFSEERIRWNLISATVFIIDVLEWSTSPVRRPHSELAVRKNPAGRLNSGARRWWLIKFWQKETVTWSKKRELNYSRFQAENESRYSNQDHSKCMGN